MYCPKCKPEGTVGITLPSMKTKVIDSRMQSNQIVRRRRKCQNCNHKFTTWESPMNIDLRETLLKRPREKLNKIKKQAQEIIDGINKNE